MIKAKKSLGQNFLVDASVCRRIIEAVKPEPGDLVIEIGPGRGALTRLLTSSGAHVVAIELDSDLANALKRTLAAQDLRIIEGDALRIDYGSVIADAFQELQLSTANSGDARVRVVANLPYYISTPIMERLIQIRGRLFDMTLMLQTEVVERMASPPGSRDYGYLSVLVQFYCTVTELFKVPPEAFRPSPKVSSSVVRLLPHQYPKIENASHEDFFSLVSSAFSQRRKTIANNLKAASQRLGITNGIETILDRAGIDPGRRPETLSIEEFGALYRATFTR